MTGASNIVDSTLIINRWTPQPKNISHLGELLLVCKGSGYGKTVINTVGDMHIARQFMSITPYEGVSIDYINLFLKAKLNEIKKNGQGVIPGIDRGSVLNLMFPVPTVNEQPRIIEKYKALEVKIDDYDSQYRALEKINTAMPQKLKSSILQYAIQGKLVPQDPNDEPASVLLERIQAEKEQMIKDGKIKRDKNESYIYRGSDNLYYEKFADGHEVCVDDELPFEIPDNWCYSRLNSIIMIKSGENLTQTSMTIGGTIPVYGGNGITGYHSEINTNKRTVVIGRVGFHCGSIHITPVKAWITDNAFRVIFSEKNISIEYLAELLREMDLKKYSNSTAQPVVSGKSIYPLIIAMPPLAEQKRIIQKLYTLKDILN